MSVIILVSGETDNLPNVQVDHPEASLTLFQSLWKVSSLSLRCVSMPKGFPDCLAQLDNLRHLVQGCQIFLGTKYQNGEKYT
jgi:hypothetical protein